MQLETGRTTTERQLITALAAGGRIVSPAEIANWRKNGLLPPLAAHGLGPGKGKTYCWHELDIVPRAATIFDAVKKQGRLDHALLMLFLSGFAVPLPKFRRAWAARVKLRRPPTIGPAIPRPAPALDANTLLLQPILAICAAIRSDESSAFVIRAVEHGLAMLGYGRRANAEQLCRTMGIMAMALETTDLIRNAKSGEIKEAQHYLTIATIFLDDRMEKRGQLIQAIGPALFAFILALLRSGQNATLESIAARIEEVDRPAPARPVRTLHAAANTAGAAG